MATMFGRPMIDGETGKLTCRTVIKTVIIKRKETKVRSFVCLACLCATTIAARKYASIQCIFSERKGRRLAQWSMVVGSGTNVHCIRHELLQLRMLTVLLMLLVCISMCPNRLFSIVHKGEKCLSLSPRPRSFSHSRPHRRAESLNTHTQQTFRLHAPLDASIAMIAQVPFRMNQPQSRRQ